MHIFSNLKAVDMILILVVAGFVLLISNKPRKAAIEAPLPLINEHTNSSSFLEEAEKRRERMQEEKSAQAEKEKLLKQKENSLECQFWKQQKAVSSEAKVDEKIIEFCALSSKSNLSSDAANTSSAEESTAPSSSSATDSAIVTPSAEAQNQ
jgi:hypothetical protein